MIKPYESYKDLGELWLNNIPLHWDNRKIKYIFTERIEKGYPDEQLLVASQNMGVVPKGVYGNRTVEASKDLHLLKLVKIGDFVISLRSFQGGIEYAYYQGIISPAYTVMIPNELINSHYFRLLAKSKLFIELLQLCVTGIREGQNIDYSKLKNYHIPLPPRTEQDQIVRFLDWKLSKINKLINAKKKQIELLKEQKQAIINKAVTKGLDENVPMKDSGVEWLGEIPEYWEVNKLKRYCKVNASTTHNLSNEVFIVFLPMDKISVNGEIDNSEKRKYKDVKSGFTSFKKNDVVVAKITPCFENGKGACLSELETDIGFGTTELIVLRGYENIIPRYLYLITKSSVFRLSGAEVMTGSAGQKRVPSDFIANFILGVPNIKDQQAIVEYLDEKCSQIDILITKVNEEINLLHEYRTRLISDVVTGKVDVRDVVVPDFEAVEEVSEDTEEIDEGFEMEEE